jgi:putative transposase
VARLPRLVVPLLAHYVLLRGHDGDAIARDAQDRQALLQALADAAGARAVVVHAYAVLDSECHLLLRPPNASALSATLQAFGRRYVAALNRRHRRRGTLWDGRFRAAPVAPGEPTLAALRLVDALGGSDADRGSASARCGGGRPAWLIDPPESWALGNTPFEREAAYRELLANNPLRRWDPLLEQAVRSSRAVGDEAFLAQLAAKAQVPVAPRPRGRPRGNLRTSR